MSKADDSLKTIAKGASIAFIGLMLSKILGYIYRLIVARIGVAEYGTLSLGLAISGFLIAIAVFGFDQAATRYIPIFAAKKNDKKIYATIRTILKFSGFFSVGLAILLFIFGDFIAIRYFDNPSLGLILKILAISIPFAAWRNALVNIMKGFKDVKTDVISKNIAENVFKVILTLVFVLVGYGVMGATYAYVVAMIGSLFVAMFLVRKASVYFVKKSAAIKQYKDHLFKELITYSWPLLFNGFLILVISWVDTIMLGYFRNASEVGIYNAAMPTSMFMSAFPKALIVLFLPVIAGLYAKKNDDYKILYKTIIKWVFLVNLFLLGIFLVFPQKILGVLFGSEYVIGGFALSILAVGFFMQGLILFSSRDILMLFKKTKSVFYITLSCVLLDVLLNYLLIPKYGFNGASIATSISFIAMSLLFFIGAYMKIKVWPVSWSYLKITLSLVVSLGIVYYVSRFVSGSIYWLIGLFVVLMILYFGLLLITKSFDRRDMMILKSIQRKSGLNVGWINSILRRFI